MVIVDLLSDASLRRLIASDSFEGDPRLLIFNRTATVFAILIWPAALWIWRRRPVLAVAAWAVGFGVLVALNSNAALAALIIGAVAFAVVWWRPTKASTALALVLGALVLASPLIASALPDRDTLKPHENTLGVSGFHRILIWSFVGDRIAERPVAGWGFNTSRSIPGNKDYLDGVAVALPLHPHNGSLQLWLELGLPGGLAGAVLLAFVLWRTGRMAAARIDKAATAAMVLATTTIAHLSYAVWQSWWVAAIWLAAGLMCAAVEPSAEAGGGAR
jgi:O-antigen ligase